MHKLFYFIETRVSILQVNQSSRDWKFTWVLTVFVPFSSLSHSLARFSVCFSSCSMYFGALYSIWCWVTLFCLVCNIAFGCKQEIERKTNKNTNSIDARYRRLCLINKIRLVMPKSLSVVQPTLWQKHYFSIHYISAHNMATEHQFTKMWKQLL